MTYYCVFTNVETISEVLRAHKNTQCKVNKIEPQEEIVKISLRNSLNANIFYSDNIFVMSLNNAYLNVKYNQKKIKKVPVDLIAIDSGSVVFFIRFYFKNVEKKS